MNIITRYQAALKNKSIHPNPSQEEAVALLEKAYREHTEQARTPYQGVYLWGEVGRGKTFLMDLFYESVPTERKQRLHFQEFMQYIHHELQQRQGQVDPLVKIAAHLAKEIDVLCLDELLVEDIADAMILGSLIEQLLANRLFLVITANLAPAQLYFKGWQREKFLPAIKLIEKHLYSVHVQSAEDYRRQETGSYPTYLFPDSPEAEAKMEASFLHYAQPPYYDNIALELNEHMLTVRKQGSDALWCDFHALCGSPHSAQDYLLVTQQFPTLLISHIPLLDEQHENEARRFMSLVDVCYDQGTLLIVSAAAPLLDLYKGRLLQHGFQRTVSRLWEMQTERYYK